MLQPNKKAPASTGAEYLNALNELYSTPSTSNINHGLDKSRLPDPVSYYEGEFDRLKASRKFAWVKCCFHDDRTPSMWINLESGAYGCKSCGESGGDIIDFHQAHYGISFVDAVKDMEAWSESPKRQPRTIKVDSKPRQWAIEQLRRAWGESVPADHPDAAPMRLYLQERGLEGITDIPASLRFHPAMPYHEDEIHLGDYPCMLGLIQSVDGKHITLHRTYLEPEGYKAKLPSPKKLMSPPVEGGTRGCAIQLFQAADELAVAEGIETALAVNISTGLPTWATISASGMASLTVPESVQKIHIMADLDRSRAGERAATELANRLTRDGKEACIVLPGGPIPANMKSLDWLDVMQGVAV